MNSNVNLASLVRLKISVRYFHLVRKADKSPMTYMISGEGKLLRNILFSKKSRGNAIFLLKFYNYSTKFQFNKFFENIHPECFITILYRLPLCFYIFFYSIKSRSRSRSFFDGSVISSSQTWANFLITRWHHISVEIMKNFKNQLNSSYIQ